MKTKAVITGDIINFTGLPPAKRKLLIEATAQLFHSWLKENIHAEIFRGDSYQALLERPAAAISKSIQLICWFIKHSEEEQHTALSSRISIGIGEVSYQGKNVLNSDGEAFHLSGRNFDQMKPGEFLSIHTPDPEKNKGIGVILIFMNKYIGKWTKAQAEVIFLVLQGKTQQEIAEELSLSQPSVNSRLKLAGWKEFEPAVKHISDLVEEK